MFSHTFNGLTYSDTSSSSSSSSPKSFAQSPIRPSSAHFLYHQPPAADVPSTFLPSYYPEGRYASLDRDFGLSGNGLPEYPPRNHSPSTWELLSQAGPSSRHLLDGTNIIEPHPPHARTGKGGLREMKPPQYRISPGSIASSLVNKAATAGPNSASFPMDPTLHSSSASGSGSGSNNAHGNDPGGGGAGGGGGGGGGGAGTRYHPYSQPIARSSSGGGAGGPPSKNNTYNNNNTNNTTIPEPSPNSTAYPGNIYANIPLPERPDQDPWERMGAGVEITGEDYAQALEIYQHLLEAVPSMRAQNEYQPPPVGGQRYDHLPGLASDGLSFLSGQYGQGQVNPTFNNNEPSSIPLSANTPNLSDKRPAPNGGNDKKTPKCLGCGATETPEWRRGPMGPRTLCNACGLVHMKLQRKKKKEAEKEAAALVGR